MIGLFAFLTSSQPPRPGILLFSPFAQVLSLSLRYSPVVYGVSYLLWFGLLNAAEFTEDSRQEIRLKDSGTLELTHPHGDVVLRGWAQDRVRVRVRKTVVADSIDDAKHLFALTDFRAQVVQQKIEVASQYGKILTTLERLRGVDHSKVRMDMTVEAPFTLPARVWTARGGIRLKNWNANLEIRSSSGPIQVDSFKGDSLKVECSSCPVTLNNLEGSVHSVVESGEMNVRNFQGEKIYLETGSGRIHLSDIKGDQLYVSKSGEITGDHLNGTIVFRQIEGLLALKDVGGHVSGMSQLGSIFIEMTSWKPRDNAFIETQRGDVHLVLPHDFSGEFDLRAYQGVISTDFQYRVQEGGAHLNREQDVKSAGIQSQIRGIVGEGDEILKIVSLSGNIQIRKSGS